ncbi:MAG: LamG domain-containing protein [Bacteroidota bacterium]
MKYILSITLVTIILTGYSCRMSPASSEPPPVAQTTGTITLSFAKAPADIVQNVATLSRPDLPSQTMKLASGDSGSTASGSFQNIRIGTWHLEVDALDDSNNARYSGQTDVQVFGGLTTRVDLTLLNNTGNLDIHVTWGWVDTTTFNRDLMMYLPFNGTTEDVSGFGNSGFSQNPVYTADRLGRPNSAYLFDGFSNFITVQNSPSLNPTNQLTITMWLRVDQIQNNYMPLFVKGGPVVGYYMNREYAALLKQNYYEWYPEWKSAGDSSGEHELQNNLRPTDLSFPVGEWEFFAFIVDRVNHQMLIYTNGDLTYQTYDSYSTFNVNSYPLVIGATPENVPQTSPFKGAMDNFRIYRRVLSGMEIQSLYHSSQ